MTAVVCKTQEDLDSAAIQLLTTHPGERVFALSGPMGAGKTTFIRYICARLGVTDLVQSPTFSIINEYRTGDGESVFHFDFYRIRNITEVFDIGYEDYLYSGAYCFLEWPELVENLLPPGTVRVNISGIDERLIEF